MNHFNGKQAVSSYRMAIGIGIDSVPSILQFCPQLIKNIFGSSLMVSFLIVFFLNLIVPEDNSAE